MDVHCNSHFTRIQGIRNFLSEMTSVRAYDLKQAKNLSKTPSDSEKLKRCILRHDSTHFSQFWAGAGTYLELFVVVPLCNSRQYRFTVVDESYGAFLP